MKRNTILMASLCAVMMLLSGAAQAVTFPVATNSDVVESSFGLATDGTNYLAGFSSGTNVCAQLVSSNGAVMGSTVIVGGGAGVIPPQAQVVFAGTNYLVAWSDTSISSDVDIFGQFISRSGAKIGSPFPLLQGLGSHGFQAIESLATDGTNYLVVWMDETNLTGNSINASYGQLVTATGALSGAEFVIAQVGAPNPAQGVTVAFGKTNYLAAWQSGYYEGNSHNGHYTTYGAFISPGGGVGQRFPISQTNSPDNNLSPGVAFDGTNYLVVWNRNIGTPDSNVNNKWAQYGRVVSSDGIFRGQEAFMTAAWSIMPSLAFDGSNYLMAWSYNTFDPDHNIYFRFFDTSARPLGEEFTVFSSQGTNPPLGAWTGVVFDGKQFAVAATLGVLEMIGNKSPSLRSAAVYGGFIPASTAPQGSLQVSITPPGAVKAGAEWQVDTGTYERNDTTVTHLATGAYIVSFKPISGWNTPSSQMIVISNGVTTTAAGAYTLKEKPTLAITSPEPGQAVSNGLFTVSGTVKDDVAVESVFYQLNSNGWTLATPSNSWSNWTASVTLNPGANTIRAYAQDTNGSFSITNKVTFTFIPSAILYVSTNGFGAVHPKDNGKLLAIGTNYTLTAVANPDNLFSNWVASGSENFVSNHPVLKFKMQSGLTLTANFVTNVFLAAKGTYNGLFAPANAPRQQTNSGAISLSVTTNGALSGKLTIGTNTHSLNGQFDPAGTATITTTNHHGESNLVTTLQLDFASQTVSGSVTDGSFEAQVMADLEQKTTNYEGRYTLIIPGTNDPTVGPYGTSCGTATVESGAISFEGYLADGTNAVSQPSFVSKDGYWPFYVALYGGHGSLWSWNCLTNTNGAMIIFSTNASWINPTNSSKAAVYRSGFTNEQAAIIGSVYTWTNKPLLSLTSEQLTNLQAILEWDEPPFAITNTQIILASNGTITVPGATVIAGNTNGLALTITKTNGVISGSFVNPFNARQTLKVKGVLLQGQTNAQGYFLGTNQSGTFLLRSP